MPNILEIIPQRVPLIDQRTGLVSREWYRFFFELFTKIGPTTFSIEDLQVGPQNSEALADAISIAQQAQLLSQTNSDIAADIAAAAQQAQLLSLTQGQIDELAKQVQALALAPSITPHLRNRAYGTFYDTTTQTAAAINTAYPLTFNSTNLSNGVYIGSPASRIYVAQNGVYNMQFSAQLDNTSGGNHLIFIWLRINGVNVANSAGQVRLKGTDDELVTSWNYVEQLKAGDYFELVWSVDNTSVQILAQAAAAPVPAIPSIILTVTDNISAYQD